LWLGVASGLAAAVAFNVNYMIGHVNAATLMWGMANLFIFEIPAGVILGMVVVLVVLLARALVPENTSRKVYSVVTGGVALLSSGLVITSVLHGVPVPGSVNVVAWIAGTLFGIACAVVSYRHPAGAGIQRLVISAATTEDSRQH